MVFDVYCQIEDTILVRIVQGRDHAEIIYRNLGL